MKKCTVESCEEKHEAKGYCKRHYRSYYKYGDPLYIENNKLNKTAKSNNDDRLTTLSYEETHKTIDGEENKLCRECSQFKPMNKDYFYINKSNGIDGFHPYCKACSREKSNNWRKDNREQVIEKQRNWYQNNLEVEREKRRKQKRTTKERNRETLRKWHKNNKDKLKEYRIYRDENKKHEISKSEWEACKQYFDYSCAYCGMKEEEHKKLYKQQLHKEHVEHNGANDLSNCVPSCRSCNGSKNVWNVYDFFIRENIKDIYIEKIEKWLDKDYLNYIQNK